MNAYSDNAHPSVPSFAYFMSNPTSIGCACADKDDGTSTTSHLLRDPSLYLTIPAPGDIFPLTRYNWLVAFDYADVSNLIHPP